MAYNSIVEMANNESLVKRIAAAAAGEALPSGWSPEGWAYENRWKIVASPGWADNWAYAKDTATINQNPDLGERDDVITDAAILSAVQAVNV